VADEDQSQKTEEPSQKRLGEAQSKGQVVESQEVSHWFTLAAATLVVGLFGAEIGHRLVTGLTPFLAAPHAMLADSGHLAALFARIGAEIGLVLVPPVVVLVAAALLANRLQHPLVFSLEPLRPKLESLNPLQGLKDLFSSTAAVDLAKSLLKLVLVAAAAAWVLWPERHRVETVITMELADIVLLVRTLTLRLMIAVLSVLALIAGADYGWTWWRHHKNLRMSKQELKDEQKDAEGDPKIKAKIKQIRIERAQRRMMAEVPKASVVITNPTHFAVALRYEGGMAAPRLVAKGVDALARRIREVAEANGVPVVENPPVARALHAAVELDQEIPPTFYKAVAEIIGYVMRLQPRR
jgi:flagellar biosynthetic protein FlhB